MCFHDSTNTYTKIPHIVQRQLLPPNGGAEPPCGWHSVTKLDLKCCKGKINLKRILDSKVGSSDLLGGLPIYSP
jgi:hypothetical protein